MTFIQTLYINFLDYYIKIGGSTLEEASAKAIALSKQVMQELS